MPTLKTLNGAGKYHDSNARQDVISYILKPGKTPHHFIGGVEVDMNNPAQSMTQVAQAHGKDSRIRLHHCVISFHPDEVDALNIVQTVAEQISEKIGETYQTVYAVHEDTDHPHVHVVYNSVSYATGNKYHGSKKDYYALVGCVKSALRSNGINELITDTRKHNEAYE